MWLLHTTPAMGSPSLPPLHIFYTQDFTDADNFASTVGMASIVKKEAARGGRFIHLWVDISTPYHDFRVPRYKGADFEDYFLAEKGARAMPPEYLTLPTEGVLEDTELVQAYEMLMVAELLYSTGVTELPNVMVTIVPGILTKQCIWDPLVPYVFLYYDLSNDVMRAFDADPHILIEKEWKAWTSTAEEGVYEDPWAGLLPATSDGVRLPVKEAMKNPRLARAMEALRLSLRSTLIMDIGVAKMRQERRLGRQIRFSTKVEVLEKIGSHLRGEAHFCVCAAAGLAAEMLKRALANPHLAVCGATLSMLTLDPADNLVGRQFNEALCVHGAADFLRLLQTNHIPTVACPTQLSKPRLTTLDNSRVPSATKLAGLVEGYCIDKFEKYYSEKRSGVSCAVVQRVWNLVKRGPQGVFDVAPVWFLGAMLAGELHEKVLLQVVCADYERGVIHDWEGGCFCMPLLGVFRGSEFVGPALCNPFLPQGEQDFLCDVLLWYS